MHILAASILLASVALADGDRHWLARAEGSIRGQAAAGPIDAAIAAIARHNPDVILLDVVLPKGDGFTFCRRLKIDAATRLTPVIMVTALTDRESRISGRQAGAMRQESDARGLASGLGARDCGGPSRLRP